MSALDIAQFWWVRFCPAATVTRPFVRIRWGALPVAAHSVPIGSTCMRLPSAAIHFSPLRVQQAQKPSASTSKLCERTKLSALLPLDHLSVRLQKEEAEKEQGRGGLEHQSCT
eukprot:67865-Rhodomonas_salina.2